MRKCLLIAKMNPIRGKDCYFFDGEKIVIERNYVGKRLFIEVKDFSLSERNVMRPIKETSCIFLEGK